jgi:hypothetical protein
MALVSGTYTRYDAQGLREHLTDIIYDISPTATPFMSGAGVGQKAKQTLMEWHCQISRKTVILSDTLEEVDKAGRRSEMALQTMKRAKELKRDMETILLRAQAGSAGTVGAARTLAGINAWLKSNIDFHTTTGGNPTYASGVPGAVRTDGTQRAFTETIAKAVIQSGFTNGAEFSTLMVGPFNKTVVSSSFSGIATRNFDLSNVSARPTAIIASADVYVSDFGTLRVIPNRFQRERDAWFIDWEFVSLSFLRPFKRVNLAKTGDAEKKMLIVEYTLQVKNEAGLGLAADLTTS